MKSDMKAPETMEENREGNTINNLSHFFVNENKVR